MVNIYAKSSLDDLLFILRRNIVEAVKKEGVKHDLTFSQIEVMRFIGPSGIATMKSIAEYLKITPPSATEIITDMEKKGLVKRVNDKKDRRIVHITFTPMAKKVFTSVSKRKEAVLKKMIYKLNSHDRKNLERIIRIIISQ